MLELSHIEHRLSKHRPASLPRPESAWKQACVALALAGTSSDLHMCFILRSSRPDDPWSGQMALPGGRAADTDPDRISVAIRETHEEVGLQLSVEQCLGALSELPIGRSGHTPSGVLSPFVFYAGRSLPKLHPETKEVAAAYWIGLNHLWSEHNWSSTSWHNQPYPGISFDGQLIWGLTLRVLTEFSNTLAHPLPICDPLG